MDTQLIQTDADAQAFVETLIARYGDDGYIGFDIETEVIEDAPPNQIGPLVAYSLYGVSRDDPSDYLSGVIWLPRLDDPAKVTELLVDVPLIGHNLTYDFAGVRQHLGVCLRKPLDTQYAYQLLTLGTRRFYASLAALARIYLGEDMEGKDDLRTSFKATGDPLPGQVEYAANDTRVVVEVWQLILRQLQERDLMRVFEIEMGALPGLVEMTVVGLPYEADRWRAEKLIPAQRVVEEAERALAVATSDLEAQGTLFADSSTLSWSPDSDQDVKRVLNRYERERLIDIFPNRADSDEPLGRFDSADKSLLGELIKRGSEIAKHISDWRVAQKILSTYGEAMLNLMGGDGRFHPSYNLGITDTGRLSSNNPNAQNNHPHMKYFTRTSQDRAFIMLDFSQEELRIGAVITGDPDMVSAYQSGTDLHSLTAAKLMGVDYDTFIELHKDGDPEAKKMRQIAKRTNFGGYYGVTASALSRNLAGDGLDIPVSEAQGILDGFFESYPKVDEWAKSRDQFVAEFAAQAGSKVDWAETFRLDEDWHAVSKAKSVLRKELGYEPTVAELSSRTGLSEDRILDLEAFDYPLVIGRDGKPLGFESRTVAGRIRHFRAPVDDFYMKVVTEALAGRNSKPDWLLREFRNHLRNLSDEAARGSAEAHQRLQQYGRGPQELLSNVRPRKRKNGESYVDRKSVERSFSDKVWKRAFCRWLWETWPRAAEGLNARALEEVFLRQTNAYRNHPVQGGGAEVMLRAVGTLWPALLEKYPGQAWLVQTVHDSLVLEAELSVAKEVAELAHSHMVEAFASLFGTEVPIQVDMEIAPSLAAVEQLDLDNLPDRWEPFGTRCVEHPLALCCTACLPQEAAAA